MIKVKRTAARATVSSRIIRDRRRPGTSQKPATDFGEHRVHLREIAVLLVRVLKLLGFDSTAIAREFVAATGHQRPKSKRLVNANLAYWARVLARWAEDPQFTTEEGVPRDLPLRGIGETFATLVASELPGEDPKHCLQILIATKSVTRLSNGRLRWRSRAAISHQAVNSFEALRPLRALLLNLQVSPEADTNRRIDPFTRGVSGFAVTERDAADLRLFLESQGMMFLETVDNWLRQRANRTRGDETGTARLVRPYVGLIMTGDGDLPPRSPLAQ